MSNLLKENIGKVKNYFQNFSNFIELEDFRSFLLFTLTSQIPTNMLTQLGLGGSREVINLPYNPVFNIYYQKINLLSSGALIIYVKNNPLSEELVLEKDNALFKNYLNTNEISAAFHGKEKFLLPKLSDCSVIEKEEDAPGITLQIDDLFFSLDSFIATLEPNILFAIEGKENDPDILFTFNMMPEFPGKLNKNILKIDAYLDEDHKTRDITYIKREEDYKLVYMKEIKEISHTELYKALFSLVLHIKSFDSPY